MPFPNLTTEVDQQLANIRQTAKTIARHASDVGEYMEESRKSLRNYNNESAYYQQNCVS